MKLTIKRLFSGAALPAPATDGAAGYDLRACLLGNDGSPRELRSFTDESGKALVTESGQIELLPGDRLIIPVGFATSFASEYRALVYPRSGLATKGLAVVNAPGLIDSDYRGEWGVILQNIGASPITLSHGERIAQAVFAPAIHPAISEGEIEDSERGAGGFGSTGT